MTAFQQFHRSRTSRLLAGAALLLVAGVFAFIVYERFVAAPARENVTRRYNDFRAVVASGEVERIMQFVAPEFRSWAESRLHLYQSFALPLDHRAAVSVFFNDATICPVPGERFLIFRGGHVIKLVRHDGQWFLGRVFID
ncbi:MAG TPA: hypothetical protein VF614_05275 [Chthoniobacteraceae bacterium]|jgi:hypothetical protein